MKFVDRHIDSIEQLEILLLLAESGREWSAAEILQNLQSSAGSVSLRLASLQKTGLIAPVGGCWQFTPADEAVARVVHELAEAYRERRVRIIEAIYAPKPDAAQTFADAFKFKKKE